MRSLALALMLASVAAARPHAQPKAPPAKVLKSLPPAPAAQKLVARDAQDVRVLILASPT